MKTIEKGQVFSFKSGGPKYVYYKRDFIEYYNAGGMGEYTHNYIKLDNLVKIGNVEDTEELNKYIEQSKNQHFDDNIVIHTDEAPFEISSRSAILYTVRRKELKVIEIYE